MGNANNLYFGNKVNYYEGVIVEVREDLVAIDVKGRLGYMELPYDLLIAKDPLLVGQTVGWKMSFIEQLAGNAGSEYHSGVQNSDKTYYMEGVVTNIEDCAISMDIKDDQGYIKTPMRMLLSDVPFELGQSVGWNMTKIVQLGPDADDKYVSNIMNRNKRALEISSRNNEEEK